MLKALLETRYLVPGAYFILTAALLLASPHLWRARRFAWALPFIAIGAFLLHKPAGGLVRAIPPHPLSVCLKEIQKTYPLKSGIGTYWNAHEVNLGGSGDTPVRAFIDRLDFHFWVNSRRFIREPFNFIVARDRVYRLDLDFIKETIGSDFAFEQRCDAAGTDIYVLSAGQEAKLSAYLTARYGN